MKTPLRISWPRHVVALTVLAIIDLCLRIRRLVKGDAPRTTG